MGEVTLHDISKRFTLRIDGEQQTVQALSRVSFSVQDGEIVALIGPSGCGKTTALRIAMGLETASAGKVTVDGLITHRLPLARLAHAVELMQKQEAVKVYITP